MEKLSCQIVGFVVSMVLARLLTPADYGTVALTSIFFAVTGVLVDGGFGNALIQKKDADDIDFNSVFYLNFALSSVAYVALFFAAPWIADFYQTPVLKPVVRISALTFLFNAINAIQGAELTKKMLFHLSFRISLITTFTYAVCGITLAFMGYGVWALVWSSVVTAVINVISKWFIIAWRPRLMFSWARLKPLFSYGWKMAASGLLDQFFVNLNGLLIGKFYSKVDLAFVNKGQGLPELAMSQVDSTLGRVSFPALVQMQDDPHALREAMRRMMRCSTFLVFPLMVGVAACAKSELLLLYGEQWLPAAPYMMLACFTFALWPFHTINLKGIMALGRSDVFLKLEVIKKVSKLAFIFAFFPLGVLPFMAACAFALGPLSVIINAWPNKKLLDYTLKMQILDVLPTALICIAEAAVVFGIDVVLNMVFKMDAQCPYFNFGSQLHLNLFLALKLFCQFIGGSVTFGVLAYAFKLQPMQEYMRIVRPFVEKRIPWSGRLFRRVEG